MRILFAEDEKALSKALTAILERNNYSVDAVFDGQEALEYLEADNYDCVILDIMMPKVDGITVLKEIRKKGNLIPVLMLTAKSEVDDKVLGLDAGANDYLTKPFHSKELLARIRAITRTQTAQTNSRLQFGNVTLDRATFELSTPMEHITIPEDLDYTGVFDSILKNYTDECELVQVKTTNMGSLFRLTYNFKLKNAGEEKNLIDELRCRNGNLEITVSRQENAVGEL